MPRNRDPGVLRPRDGGRAPLYWKTNVTNTIEEQLGRGVNDLFWATSDDIYDGMSFERGELCSGLVYGSVQSGKTFSMLGVSALALDDDVDIVIILGGSKSALRQQTHTRVIEQLARTNTRRDNLEQNSRRYISPSWNSNYLEVEPTSYINPSTWKAMYDGGKKIISTILKHHDHLKQVRLAISEIIRGIPEDGELLNLLIVDDEADDISVPGQNINDKTTSRQIVNIWQGNSAVGKVDSRIAAAYLAYTATPQANILRSLLSPSSPLAIKNFVKVLKPSLQHNLCVQESRALYNNVNGLEKSYHGGEIFYNFGREDQRESVVSITNEQIGEDLDENVHDHQITNRFFEESMYHFFITAAMKLHEERTDNEHKSFSGSYESEEELEFKLPKPHTMLFHPSHLGDKHLLGMVKIAKWINYQDGIGFADTVVQYDDAEEEIPVISNENLVRRFSADEDTWRTEFTRINRHIDSFNRGSGSDFFQFADGQWEEIKHILISEIFPNFNVCIINSRLSTDDKMEYDNIKKDGRWYPPRHHLSILVSGNVLARGITIRGLCTSVLMRNPGVHSADNDMQMQRWFGYRKKEIVLSRVICFEDQVRRLKNYHRDDTSARLAYINTRTPEEFLDVLVRQGLDYKATLRVDGSGNARQQGILPPGEQCWSFNLGEENADFLINAEKIKTFLQANPEEIMFEDISYGWIRRDIPSSDIADFLDSFRFRSHIGDRSSVNVWNSIQRTLNLVDRFYRPGQSDEFFSRELPGTERIESEEAVRYSPYRVAAYLRFWNALQNARLEGFPIDIWETESTINRHWSNLTRTQKSAPNFNFVVRNSRNENGDLNLGVQCGASIRNRISGSRWGSRGDEGEGRYPGDQLIDLIDWDREDRPRRGGLRRMGDPGLIYILPAVDPGTGENYIQMGVIFPEGGPVILDLIGIGEIDE